MGTYCVCKIGVMLWGNSVNCIDLFIIQKKLVRILAQIDNTESCKPYFKEFKLLTLPSIYILDICTFVYKNINTFKKIEDSHNINTRNKNKLCLPQSRIKMLNESPYYMAIKLFNKLPIGIKNQEYLLAFQRKLKNYLIQNCYYSIKEYFENNNFYKYK